MPDNEENTSRAIIINTDEEVYKEKRERYEHQAQLLADYLPEGKFWTAKNVDESNLRKLLNGLGKEYVNIEDSLEWLRRETCILTTYDLIEVWEYLYEIPDKNGIFEIDGKTIEQRRFNIFLKELMNGADRYEDWEYIAKCFGFNVRVRSATETDLEVLDNPRYNIVVEFLDFEPPQTFTMYFDIYFSDVDISLLKKVFNIIKPANCFIIYI